MSLLAAIASLTQALIDEVSPAFTASVVAPVGSSSTVTVARRLVMRSSCLLRAHRVQRHRTDALGSALLAAEAVVADAAFAEAQGRGEDVLQRECLFFGVCVVIRRRATA